MNEKLTGLQCLGKFTCKTDQPLITQNYKRMTEKWQAGIMISRQ